MESNIKIHENDDTEDDNMQIVITFPGLEELDLFSYYPYFKILVFNDEFIEILFMKNEECHSKNISEDVLKSNPNTLLFTGVNTLSVGSVILSTTNNVDIQNQKCDSSVNATETNISMTNYKCELKLCKI